MMFIFGASACSSGRLAARALGAPGAVLSYLAVLNVILGTFNLRAPLTPAGSATAS